MSKVKVVSGGLISNTRLYINGEEQQNIESIRWEINKTDRIGILTVTFYHLEEGFMEYKEHYVNSRDTRAFNDEEDRIEFHLDGDIPGTPIANEEPKTIMDWQRKYNKNQ